MIRRILATLCLLLAGVSPAGAIGPVQASNVAKASSATSATTTAISTTTGNMVVLFVSYFGTFSSVSDSGSHSWSTAVGETEELLGNGKLRILYNCNITGSGSHTFTLTLTAANFPTIQAVEISGQATSLCLDQNNANADGGSGTSHPASAIDITTTQADEILVTMGESGNSTTFTLGGSGWTQQGNVSTDASFQGILTATKVVAATGTYGMAYTTGSSVRGAQGIASFKAAAAAGGGSGLLGGGYGAGMISE